MVYCPPRLLLTHCIDIWSMGCVFAEMMIGHPLFPGESGVDQLVEIIKVHTRNSNVSVWRSVLKGAAGARDAVTGADPRHE